MKSFGTMLREQRQRRGMTLRQLGELIAVCAPFLCDVEHDRRGFSAGKLAAACEALGLDVDVMGAAQGTLPQHVLDYMREHPASMTLLRLLAEKQASEHDLGVLLQIVDGKRRR